jgi:hypothetical protein
MDEFGMNFLLAKAEVVARGWKYRKIVKSRNENNIPWCGIVLQEFHFGMSMTD